MSCAINSSPSGFTSCTINTSPSWVVSIPSSAGAIKATSSGTIFLIYEIAHCDYPSSISHCTVGSHHILHRFGTRIIVPPPLIGSTLMRRITDIIMVIIIHSIIGVVRWRMMVARKGEHSRCLHNPFCPFLLLFDIYYLHCTAYLSVIVIHSGICKCPNVYSLV